MVLMKILRKTKQKEKEIRILMLGLDNAGKSTLVKKFNNENVDCIPPTLGFEIKTIEYKGYKLNIWDVGGQTSIRSYWKNYFEKTDAIIWVFDSADLERIYTCKKEIMNLLNEERLDGATLVLLANKQDLAGALSEDKISQILDLKSLLRNRHWFIRGCSAYHGDGLITIMNWLVEDVSNRIFVAY